MKAHTLQITPDILKLIAEIDEFRGSWRFMQNLAPERLASLRRSATIESIGSSTRIEGSRLTDSEVEKLLTHIASHSLISRDEQEVAGHAEVMDVIFQSFEEIALTENYIKQLHSMLLQHSDKDERHRGHYKTLDNHVEAFDAEGNSLGIVFQAISPFATPLRMQELVYWTHETLNDKSLHPLLVVGMFVVVFLQIHPFQDGNGRLSRVLTTLLLLKTGYGYVPYSSLESVVEQNTEGYYLSLRRTQTTLEDEHPNWLPWLRFFLHTLKVQKDRLAQKIELDTSWNHLPREAVSIMEFVRKYGRITVAEAEQLTAIPRATVKKRLSDLVAQGLLVRHGQGRGSWYGAS